MPILWEARGSRLLGSGRQLPPQPTLAESPSQGGGGGGSGRGEWGGFSKGRGGGRVGLVWFGLASTQPVVWGVTLTVHARPKAWECGRVSSLLTRRPARLADCLC